MRREYVYIIILITCIISIIYGITKFVNVSYHIQEAKQVENIENIYENTEVIRTAVQEKKVSPNSTFALKKSYDECSHFEYDEVELPKELVNLTRQEVEDYYSDWEVAEFTDDKLVLCKEINGYCNQHFLIKLDNENVNVYRLSTLGDFNEYKKTDISRDYLPEEDIKSLEEGISVFGEGKLSSVLEDFE